ncbi:MAG: valine--tRNA ligase [Tissierellia bacterium]|nr:valine--tRNA ligase [Tissierellia bacterium]
MERMKKVYEPKDFEERLYSHWMASGAFHPEIDPAKKPFTIVMPPPNVTGNLHMGHAMNNTLQDILIRYKRMAGYAALWVPGTDHASISTEVKVVERLAQRGITKEELGREKFLEEAWAWTEEYGGNIKNQLKKLGVSCDWDRERFTLDEDLSDAVLEVFVRLYEKGLIYRGHRIINWCPHDKTALSDAEVEHEEQDGKIWTFRYPVEGEDSFIEISTTRPETIPGDMAVAVHPEDERYQHLVGKMVRLPILDRLIPIVADEYVDREFGTGAVKITPSHDPNDFEVGARHNLGHRIIMDETATLNDEAGKYAGLDRYDARKAIIQDFTEGGFFVKEESHHNAIGHCERCKTVIEPLLSKQWFVEMKSLAEPALKAYTDGDLNIIPDRFGKIYSHWLENIRDWTISRQLWWGHQLPVYYCDDCGEVMVSKEEIHECTACGSSKVHRDPDTLDTWFSSALWPFSVLGWPKETADYEYFYPTDVLITGYDIIFFWVIRMVFSALEQTGKLPFDHVYLTGLVRDEEGRKMSKSLGNGIDPLDVIDEYGTDALRFTLCTGTAPGGDQRFIMKKVESNRNFCNKLWNAARFVLMNLPEDFQNATIDPARLISEDKWILAKLNRTITTVTEKLEAFEFGFAADTIHDFIWEDFCDWYIEMVKPRLYGEDTQDREEVYAVLIYVLEDILKLLHPFMPFITEEIWSYLPGRKEDLIVAQWPQLGPWEGTKEMADIAYVQEAIRALRNAKAEMDIEPFRKSPLYVRGSDERVALIQNEGRHFKTLANITQVEALEGELDEDALTVVLDGAELLLPMKDLVDYAKELERVARELEKAQDELQRAQRKLSNENFVSKAKAEVVQAERDKVEKYREMVEKLQERQGELQAKI